MSDSAHEFRRFAVKLAADAITVWDDANQEYSNDDAWTSNFDYAALLMRLRGHDIKPRDTAMVYLMKSIFSIAKGDSRRQSMRSRYIDAINYLLMMAHMDEHNHNIMMLDVEKHYHYADEPEPELADADGDSSDADDIPEMVGDPQLINRAQEILREPDEASLKLRSGYQQEWRAMSAERRADYLSFKHYMSRRAMQTAMREYIHNEAAKGQASGK